MKIIDALAAFHNWLSDKDFIWWPFSFLRPEPNQVMHFSDVLKMTSCFGGLVFVFYTVFAVANNAFSFDGLIITFTSCFLGFFFWFAFITKPLWNRRAKKLIKQ